MINIEGTGPTGLLWQKAVLLIANSQSFQHQTGAINYAEALEFIHAPTLASYGKIDYSKPFCVIERDPTRTITYVPSTHGNIPVDGYIKIGFFDRPRSMIYEEADILFSNFIDGVIADMLAWESVDDRIVIKEMACEGPHMAPFEANTQDEQFMQYRMTINWGPA